MGDSGSFWGTVVQVVPVLFIAVMFEFRYLLTTSAKSDDQFLGTRGFRAFMSTIVLAVSAMLTVAFLLGVGGLKEGVPTTDASAGVATFSLGLGAGVAVGTPGLFLFIASTSDIWLLLYRKMPWSQVSRSERHVQRGRDEEARLLREAVGVRHDFLMRMSTAYVVASFYDRAIAGMLPEDQPKARVAVDELYARADNAREALGRLDDVLNAPYEWPQIPRLTKKEIAFIRGRMAQEIARTSV